MTTLERAFDRESFDAAAREITTLLSRLLGDERDAGPVMPRGTPAEMCARFPADFPEGGAGDFADVVARAVASSTKLQSRRFVGHQVATPLPHAALCDLVSSFMNNGMAVFEMGPAASAMERAVLSWMSQQARFPSTSSGGVLTSGGSLGNLTAILAARQKNAGFDVWRRGLKGGPQLCIFVADSAHYSVARSARMLGLGDDGVVLVETDERLKMKPASLVAAIEEARKKKRQPLAVVASAGSTAGGAFDPIADVADICEREKLWLHIDGAHGASLLLSDRHRAKLGGVERADSIVWDAHKLMLMPALVTAVLFRDGKDGAAAFAQDAGYLFDDGDDWSDIGKRTVECTKRMMSLKLYACLRSFGTKLFADHVDRCCELASSLAAQARTRGMEVLVEPECNIVCFRPRGIDGGKVAAVRKRILDDGRFYIVQLHRKDGLWLRCTLSHPLTTEADIAELLDLVVRFAV